MKRHAVKALIRHQERCSVLDLQHPPDNRIAAKPTVIPSNVFDAVQVRFIPIHRRERGIYFGIVRPVDFRLRIVPEAYRIPNGIATAGRGFIRHPDGVAELRHGESVSLFSGVYDVGGHRFCCIFDIGRAQVDPHRRQHSGIRAVHQGALAVDIAEVADIGHAP